MKLLKTFFTAYMVLCMIVNAATTEEKDAEKKKNDEKEYYRIKKNEEVVVTATLTQKALKDCSESVSIVDRRAIESIPAANSLNILDHFPGIFVNRTGDFGRADVDIRGLGQTCRQIAVLVDGKPEKMGLFGCAVSHAFLLDNVDRIEVVKGPASVLYGGEALGGAVNLITRMPDKKFDTDLTVFYGSYNTQHLNLKQGGIIDNLKYFFTFDKQKSDGHVENSEYSGDSFSGKLAYDLSKKTTISLQGRYFDGKKNEPGTIDSPISGYWNDYKRGAVDLTAIRKSDTGEFSLKIYRNFGTHQFSDGWDSRDYTNGAMVRFTTRGITRHEFTVGGDLRYFGGKSLNWPKGEWRKNDGSVFLNDEYIPDSHWILSAGLRLQSDSLFGEELCPRAGVVFQATDATRFRASVGKGFRSPQLNELYMFPPANPDLKPERVWNYELGAEHDFGTRLIVKGSVFHMKGNNMIQTIVNPKGLPPYIFANTGEFAFNGAEIELEAPMTSFLSGNIGYTYLDTGDLTKGRPGQKIDFSLRLNAKHILAALQGQYVTDYFAADFSQKRIPSYFLLNSRFVISVFKDFDLLMDVNNLFNKYYCIYGEYSGLTAGLYQMPGRNIQFGIRFRP
jgi:outer membrane receptor protein involved in Fe transport